MNQNGITTTKEHLVANIHHTKSQEELVKYVHQYLFSSPVSTLVKAIKNNQLISFPITTKDITKILPPSTATYKWHMKRFPQGFCSTKIKALKNQGEIEDWYPQEDMNPPLK